MKETGGKGVDVILETSGDVSTINESFDIIAQGGTIAVIGFYEVRLNGFDIDKFVMKRIKMVGILGEFGLPQEVIDWMKKAKISFKPLITHRFKFDEAIEAMKTADKKNDTKIKMLVEIAQL